MRHQGGQFVETSRISLLEFSAGMPDIAPGIPPERSRVMTSSIRAWGPAWKTGVAAMLSVLLLATASPSAAQTSTDEKIQALEKALRAIQASAAAGEDVTARIEALQKELEALKAQVASAATGDSGTPGQGQSAAGQAPPPGVQGAPNPLRSDARPLTGRDLPLGCSQYCSQGRSIHRSYMEGRSGNHL